MQTLLDVSQPTANKLISKLEELGLLLEWTGREREQSWVYSDYFDIFVAGEPVE